MKPLDTTTIGGWLLLLCRLLIVWEPLSFAVVAASSINAIQVRGPGVATALVVRLASAALCVAAGRSLQDRRPSAVVLAKAALTVSGAVHVLASVSPYFPSNRVPGDAPLYAALAVAYYGGWLVYLFRSKRVAATFA